MEGALSIRTPTGLYQFVKILDQAKREMMRAGLYKMHKGFEPEAGQHNNKPNKIKVIHIKKAIKLTYSLTYTHYPQLSIYF